MTTRYYINLQNTISSFKNIDFRPKIYLILYPSHPYYHNEYQIFFWSDNFWLLEFSFVLLQAKGQKLPDLKNPLPKKGSVIVLIWIVETVREPMEIHDDHFFGWPENSLRLLEIVGWFWISYSLFKKDRYLNMGPSI